MDDAFAMQRFYESILNTTHEGLWVTDADDTIVFFNRSMEQIAGVAAADVIGLRVTKGFREETTGEFLAYYYKARTSLQPVAYEANVVTPAGRPTIQAGWLVPRLEDGRFAGMICTIEDVTEAKGTEDALLRESARAQRFLDIAPAIILALDRNGDITLLNQEGERILECDADEVVGKNWFETFLPETTRAPVMAGFARLMSGEEEELAHYENEVVTGTGRVRLIHWHNTLLRDDQGNIIGTLSSGDDVTAERKAIDALRESEEIMRYIIKHDPNAIAVYDRNLHYMAVSDRYLQDYNVSESGVLGKHHYEVFPEMPQRWRDVHQRVLQGAIERNDDDCFERADGSITYNRWECRPWYQADGSIGGMITYTEVTTERKLAEMALRDERERLRFIIDAARVGTWEWNVQTGELVCNATWATMLGYALDELKPYSIETWRELTHPHDLVSAENELDRCFEGKQPYYECEIRMKHKDGHWVWVLDRGQVMTRDTDGRPWMMFGTHIDITEHKLREEALRDQQQLLTDAGKLAGLGAAVWYAAENRWEASENWLAIHGFTKPPKTMEEVMTCAHPDDVGAIRRAFEMTLAGKAPYLLEHRIVRQDTGEVRHIHAFGEARRNSTGEIDRIVGAAMDVTDQKRAEVEHENLRNQLVQAQKMESVGRLAGGVAHDFNNMLNVILGNVDLALEDLPADHPLRFDLEEIQAAARRSASLTRQLLGFARRQVIAPKTLDPNETVGSMLTMLRRLIGEDIHLLWKPGEGVNPVCIDPAQLDQMLANLVLNARDAIDGGGTVTIETSRAELDAEYCSSHAGIEPGAYAVLSVTDDGHGMDEETVANAFEPFFTTKGVGEGTGLGLATVYGIVQQNRGAIDVTSEVGHGTTFRIYLPAQRCEESVTESGESLVQPAVRGHETILLVEDEPAILALGKKMLERLGYQVETAPTPREALRLAREHGGEIDLLLTDVVMPEMNGHQLAERLHALYPNMKRIFMSGYADDVAALQDLKANGAHFIEKPFSKETLGKEIRAVLGERR